MFEVCFTAHHNWEWAIIEGFQVIQSLFIDPSSFKFNQVHRIQFLPSQFQKSKTKPEYSLFRVEITMSRVVQSLTWMDSQAFTFLDAKDCLYKSLHNVHAHHLMPETVLLSWDVEEIERVRHSLSRSGLAFPSLLKAALGSGGFGLYFVKDTNEIVEVIKGHARRARSFPGFLEGLRDRYGDVPDWSLQRLVSPVRTLLYDLDRDPSSKDARCEKEKGKVGRKTQLRVYVVFIEQSRGGSIEGGSTGRCFLYREVEVRVPYWDEKEEMEVGGGEEEGGGEKDGGRGHKWGYWVENELVGEGGARPYNEDRRKAETGRVLIGEVEELEGAGEIVLDCVREAFLSLRPSILDHLTRCERQKREKRDRESKKEGEGEGRGGSSMAVVGVDLVVEQTSSGFQAFIVEMNNNPALPSPLKGLRMSPLYREHLPSLLASILALGLSSGFVEGIDPLEMSELSETFQSLVEKNFQQIW